MLEASSDVAEPQILLHEWVLWANVLGLVA